MPLLYLLLGVLLVIGLHFSLKWFASASSDKAKNVMRWLAVIASVVIILLLLRVGLPAIAAIFSGFLALSAILGRLMVWLPVIDRFRQKNNTPPSAQTEAMSMKKAREVLGVKEDASEEEIKKAYHALMQKLHPDSGGNDYLASQLNEAKEVLLKYIKEGL